MDLKLDRILSENQINKFIVLNFFLFFLAYIISKGFIDNEELSDKIFLITCVLSIELIYLLFSNKHINDSSKLVSDSVILLFTFLFIYIVWNLEIIRNYFDTTIFLIFHLVLVFPIIFLHKNESLLKSNILETKNFLLISFLSLGFGGILFQISYSTLSGFFILSALSILFILINILFNKSHRWIDIFFSIFFFLIISKIFLLSSPKDAFHYGWFLGPINSLSDNFHLLDNVVSQYGYLNLLFINKLSNIVNIDSTGVFIFVIICFFLIFYFLFFLQIFKLVKLNYTLITLFLSFLIFGNYGYANLSGSMFIPSSSVFRFLPSLITILLFIDFLKEEKENISKIILFYFSFVISLLWSVESLVFVLFPIFSYLIIKYFLNFTNIINFNIKKTIFNSKFSLSLGLIIFLTLFIYFKDKNIYLFYEHTLFSTSSLPKEILNNKMTLTFLFLLLLIYLILRDSLNSPKIFFVNIIWFSLFISYSAYFMIRSVDNNILNILPFILFIICSMKVNSKQIEILRKKTLYVIIFFSIISSLYSLINNKDKFYNNLVTLNFYNTPNYLSENYLPNEAILNKINQYNNLPLTLISGKTLHKPNNYLPSKGYGLPILPLESFNVLRNSTKQKLMDNYFNKANKHLILCINNCNFYFSDSDSEINSKIFLGNNVNFKKIAEIQKNQLKETLYLLSKPL